MPTDCMDCGAEDALYDLPTPGKKCAFCGWKWKPDGSVVDELPTREADADCGDIIGDEFEGVSRAAVRKMMCNDGSACTVTPSGLKKVGENTYVAACFHHKE